MSDFDDTVALRAERLVKALREARTLDELRGAIQGLFSDEEAAALASRRIDWNRLKSFGGSRPRRSGVISWDAEWVLIAGDEGLSDLQTLPRDDLDEPTLSPEAFERMLIDALVGRGRTVQRVRVTQAERNMRLLIEILGDQRVEKHQTTLSLDEWRTADARLAARIVEALLDGPREED
jgi:hypothetical protein